MRRVPHSERAPPWIVVNSTNVVIGTSTNERGKEKEDQQKTYICNVVMAGTDRSSARASAVNPSRLPARPSGLRGLTAQRGQANESAVDHQCRTALMRREPLEKMFDLENFLTREASYKTIVLDLVKPIRAGWMVLD